MSSRTGNKVKSNYLHMKDEMEEGALYNEEDYKKISLFSFIIGFFVFVFQRFMKP